MSNHLCNSNVDASVILFDCRVWSSSSFRTCWLCNWNALLLTLPPCTGSSSTTGTSTAWGGSCVCVCKCAPCLYDSLIPKPFQLPVFDCLQYKNRFSCRRPEQRVMLQETAVPVAVCACHSHSEAATCWYLVAILYGTVDTVVWPWLVVMSWHSAFLHYEGSGDLFPIVSIKGVRLESWWSISKAV